MDHEASQSLVHLQQATTRLLATVGSMSDTQAREPSLLPGWTRGHVLTHIARNAGAIGNLLRSARTGTQIPMYPSQEVRNADIEAGAGRPAADLLADVRASAAALEGLAATMPDEAWSAIVLARQEQVAAREVLLFRWTEIEVHHVDLGLGYRPADWPATFPAAQLSRAAATFAGREGVPDCVILAEGMDPLRIGSAPGTPASAERGGPVTVSGPPWAVLGWLISRGDGSGLAVNPPGPPPALPPWR